MKFAKLALASGLLMLAVAGTSPIVSAQADVRDFSCAPNDNSADNTFAYCGDHGPQGNGVGNNR